MSLESLIKSWKDDRDEEDAESGYDSGQNYCGVNPFMYPVWAFAHAYFNRGSFYHDFDFEHSNRTGQSNKRMAARIGIDLMIDGVYFWNFKFWAVMGIYWCILFVLISTIGRVIDK